MGKRENGLSKYGVIKQNESEAANNINTCRALFRSFISFKTYMYVNSHVKNRHLKVVTLLMLHRSL